MTSAQILALSPLVILMIGIVAILLVTAFYRNHPLAAGLTLLALFSAFLSVIFMNGKGPVQVSRLLVVDQYALFYIGLIIAASFFVALISYGYLKIHSENRQEFYILLLSATFGSAVLVSSTAFASFFLGLEILSVSLYALIAYQRLNPDNIEAGIKYLILAGASAAFLLFGMALIYAETGTMEFSQVMGSLAASNQAIPPIELLGLAMLIVGIGFKLAFVPFHMWTADVYQGAPAPVTAFVATVSKGGMFALLLRLFHNTNFHTYGSPLFVVFAVISIASMFAGNLLALLQKNVKRILAYSSISHLGYLLVPFLTSGENATTSITFYLVSYFITTLGAFGVVTVLSDGSADADNLEKYRGLFWQRPWLAFAFTVALFSLAGIPLTAGFIGKFLLIAAGVGSSYWFLIILLVIASGIGLFYYLRIVVMMYLKSPGEVQKPPNYARLDLTSMIAMAVIVILLITIGMYPSPLVHIIQVMATSLG
ncbi:MAG: NADH-quinone oxidoreductase subunit N [Anaerolineaceae bacterium]|nr:NADH-quinone oxidoreductase subunit N [Anaerolineaceae bacterium]